MAPHRRRSVRNYKTTVVPSDGGNLGTIPTGELNYRFENSLYTTVTVVTRTGVRFTVPYRPRQGPPFFTVMTRMTADNDVNIDVAGLSNDQGDTTSPESDAILKAHGIAMAKTGRHNHIRTCVEHRVPLADFEQRGGTLYLQNLDLLISTLPPDQIPNHPYSIAGLRDREAYENREGQGSRIMLSVQIIDQDGVFGARFMNLDGIVFRVPIVRDDDKRDGVYVVAEGMTDGEYSVQRTLTTYYTFEEADKKLGLYRTHADAVSLGAPNEKVKREYEERAHRFKMEEQQWREEKLERERAYEQEKDRNRQYFNTRETLLREHDFELKRLSQLIDERELNYKYYTGRQKETANEREAMRRETLELIKFIPAVIVGVTGLVVAVKKLASN